MKTNKQKKTVPAGLVTLMTRFYGTIDAAREAYKAECAALSATQVLWVALSGQICRKESCEVFYQGSPDAPFVIPS